MRPRPPSAPPRSPAGLSRARLAELRGLRDKRRRQAAGRFLVEGYHIVEEALLAGAPVQEVLVGAGWAQSPGGERLLARARAARVTVTEVPRRLLDDLADAESPQGVLAVVEWRPPDADGLPLPRGSLTAVLDGVQDPGNAGAILRAADAFRCSAMVFGRGSVEPLNPKVLRGGQGSHFHLPVVAGPGADEFAASARKRGARVVAAVTDGGRPLWDFRRGPEPLVVVFGNEARGVSEGVLAAAQDRLTIPLRGRAESLGVAAAAAIVLAWLSREATP